MSSSLSVTPVVSFSTTPVVSTGSVAYGGIYNFTTGVPLSNYKSMSTTTSSNTGVLMSGSSTPGISLPISLIATPGVVVTRRVLLIPSSSTPVSTPPSIG